MTTRAWVHVSLHNIQTAVISDSLISQWIEGRLIDARNTFIQNVSRGGGSGRQYGNHRASAPGEYPATDEGRLVNSVDIQLTDPREGQLDSDLIYADYLTGGTQYMAPRKMLGDALSEALRARPQADQLARAARFEPPGRSEK